MTLGKGYVHVYTGTGKGKTTCALGLLLRACGAGFRIFVAQFLKSRDYSELTALRRFDDLVTIRQYGTGTFVKGNPTDADRQAASAGFAETRKALMSGNYNLVILDEANVAVRYGLIPVDDLLGLIHDRPAGVELVITGRGADPRIIEAADLVTEMTEIKHYFKSGVRARVGIEK